MKLPYHKTEEDAINYHIALYYDMLNDRQGIRSDIDQHIEAIEEIDFRYKRALKHTPSARYREPLDYEGYKDSFIENVEFLTGVYAARKNREDKKVAKQAFLDRNKKW